MNRKSFVNGVFSRSLASAFSDRDRFDHFYASEPVPLYAAFRPKEQGKFQELCRGLTKTGTRHLTPYGRRRRAYRGGPDVPPSVRT